MRYGYVRLFYPPVPGFCLTACGVILCMFVIADLLPPASLPDPLRAMGECSLAIYILHSVIIAWFIQPLHLLLPLPLFLLCVIVFIGGMSRFLPPPASPPGSGGTVAGRPVPDGRVTVLRTSPRFFGMSMRRVPAARSRSSRANSILVSPFLYSPKPRPKNMCSSNCLYLFSFGSAKVPP